MLIPHAENFFKMSNLRDKIGWDKFDKSVNIHFFITDYPDLITEIEDFTELQKTYQIKILLKGDINVFYDRNLRRIYES